MILDQFGPEGKEGPVNNIEAQISLTAKHIDEDLWTDGAHSPDTYSNAMYVFGWELMVVPKKEIYEDGEVVRVSNNGSLCKIYNPEKRDMVVAIFEAMACAMWSLNNSHGLNLSELTIRSDVWEPILYISENKSTPMKCRDVCRATVDTCVSLIPKIKWRIVSHGNIGKVKQQIYSFVLDRHND